MHIGVGNQELNSGFHALKDVHVPASQGDIADGTPGRGLIAVCLVVCATLVMSLQDAVVKLVSNDLPLWQLFTLRSIGALALLAAIAAGQGRLGALVPRAVGWTMLRGALIVAMYVAFYAALTVLDLGVVAAAYYTGPLFITLLAALTLGDRLLPRQVVAILVGFAGVLVILRPGSDAFTVAMLIPIASALFYASAMVLTRGRCGEETALSLSVALNLCFILWSLAMTMALAALALEPETVARSPFLLGAWIAMDLGSIGTVAMLAVLNVTIHVLLARAYQIGPAPLVASFDYTYLVFAAVWGALLLGETLEARTVIGMVVIAGAGLAMLARPGMASRLVRRTRAGREA